MVASGAGGRLGASLGRLAVFQVGRLGELLDLAAGLGGVRQDGRHVDLERLLVLAAKVGRNLALVLLRVAEVRAFEQTS